MRLELLQLMLCLPVVVHLNLFSLLRTWQNWHFVLAQSLFCLLVHGTFVSKADLLGGFGLALVKMVNYELVVMLHMALARATK